MKRIIAVSLLVASVALGGLGQILSMSPAAQELSPAEKSIAAARKAIEKSPKEYQSYNALALALARRARETSDVSYYAQAEDALKQSLAISPGNFGAEKTRVWLLLGKHEFAQALEAAKALNQKVPDDVLLYGFLVDANAELGNYPDAERAAQWMLDLRPGNVPGVTRAAYLRELFGDIDGAIELMTIAYDSTPFTEREDRAWILTQIGHLQLSVGHIEEAEKLLSQALDLFPGYHYARANLAKIRILQKRYGEAVDLLEQRFDAAPPAENLYDLAEAMEISGRKEDAKRAFSEFEVKSLNESHKADNSNHELVFYYADHANKPKEALAVATREFARRHDVFTLDAYAWALHVNGNDREAREQIQTALAVGIRDSKLFYHAGEIAQAQKDFAAARTYFEKSAELHTLRSSDARAALTTLSSNELKH